MRAADTDRIQVAQLLTDAAAQGRLPLISGVDMTFAVKQWGLFHCSAPMDGKGFGRGPGNNVDGGSC
jgi:hypothetical protein